MSVDWNAHRFSGGPLALCAANSVIWRSDPARRADRFAEPAEIVRFADAANVHCARELAGERVAAVDAVAVKAIRETIDHLFRDAAGGGGLLDQKTLGELLVQAGRAMIAANPGGAEPVPLDAALAGSALRIVYGGRIGRVRICGNCGWLFEDASRNGSRLWCDMAVCGNRAKARRHYRKKSGNSHAA